MDQLVKGLSAEKHIRTVLVTIGESAAELARRHGNGRASHRALAEGLVAAALLSADAGRPEEALLVRLECDGAVGGVQVEATGGGWLRGYTMRKRIAGLDRVADPPADRLWGRRGALGVVLSVPGQVLATGRVELAPVEVRTALARYYNSSIQVPTGVEVTLVSRGRRLVAAAGLAIQRMPDGDVAAFVGILESFQEGRVRSFLEAGADEAALAELLGLPDLETTERRPLVVGCRCSGERVVEAMAALSAGELAEAVAAGNGQEVHCHMCGQRYSVKREQLDELLRLKLQSQ